MFVTRHSFYISVDLLRFLYRHQIPKCATPIIEYTHIRWALLVIIVARGIVKFIF